MSIWMFTRGRWSASQVRRRKGILATVRLSLHAVGSRFLVLRAYINDRPWLLLTVTCITVVSL